MLISVDNYCESSAILTILRDAVATLQSHAAEFSHTARQMFSLGRSVGRQRS